MNTQTQEALKMAQEVLNLYCEQLNSTFANDALKAINEALEQPAQGIELEWYNKGWTDANWEWIGLTDDEVGDLITPYEYSVHPDLDGLTHAIVQALKEKNGN
jgi:hypothetical protein